MRSTPKDHRTALLRTARSLLQSRGFNAFSFRDLAAAEQIKSSSVHYHFPTKEALGIELVKGYGDEMRLHFERWQSDHPNDALACLRAFVGVFAATATTGDRLCLAGMLSSDFATLGEPLQLELRSFFTDVERWLAQQCAASASGGARTAEQNRQLARTLIATLEGALLSARVFGEPARVRQAGLRVLELIEPKPG